MSRISDSRDPVGPGILPLQDHGFAQKDKVDLEKRTALLAVRVTERLSGGTQIGHYKIDPDSPGDLNGGNLWAKNTREIPGWSFAWPSVIAGGTGIQQQRENAEPGHF